MSEERKYSLSEIDRMRSLIYSREISRMGDGACWDDKALKREVEDMLRTYMLGGVGAAELEVSAIKAAADEKAEREAWERHHHEFQRNKA